MARAPAPAVAGTQMAPAGGKAGKKGKPQKPARSGKSLGWLQGLLCGVAAALSLSTVLILAILLAPGLAALVIDDRPSKPVARTMLLFGAAGSVQPVVLFWQVGHTMNDVVAVAVHAQTLLIAWMAAGFGWLLTEVVPLVVSLAMGVRVADERKKLIAARRDLAKEWGLPQAGGAEDADAEESGEETARA